MGVGQNLRYLFGDDYPPKVVYFKGFWDVHRCTGVLTHCHILLLGGKIYCWWVFCVLFFMCLLDSSSYSIECSHTVQALPFQKEKQLHFEQISAARFFREKEHMNSTTVS